MHERNGEFVTFLYFLLTMHERDGEFAKLLAGLVWNGGFSG